MKRFGNKPDFYCIYLFSAATQYFPMSNDKTFLCPLYGKHIQSWQEKNNQHMTSRCLAKKRGGGGGLEKRLTVSMRLRTPTTLQLQARAFPQLLLFFFIILVTTHDEQTPPSLQLHAIGD